MEWGETVPSKFKIEIVKWSWPEAVKSPNVYRDDEFVRTKTKAQAIKDIDFLGADEIEQDLKRAFELV